MSRTRPPVQTLTEQAARTVVTTYRFMRAAAHHGSFQLGSGEERRMTIRVLLQTATRMEESALQGALADCDDIDLVQANSAGAPPTDIDVVVLHEAAMGEFPAMLCAIGVVRPIGVVAIGDGGEAGSLYRVDRRGWRFAAGGQPGLAEAIRAVALAG